MAKIANVALTNTFDFWRVRSNDAFDRLSQFAINNSSLYANNITANQSFTALKNATIVGNTTTNKATVTNRFISSGNSVLGAAGKRTIVNGLLTSNGRISVTTSVSVGGNTVLGTNTSTRTITNGLLTANGRVAISTNLSVAGNTTIAGLIANGSFGSADQVLKTNGTTTWWGTVSGGGGGGQTNVFSKMLVGTTSIFADGPNDTVSIQPGYGIRLTPTIANDTFIIAATNVLASNTYVATVYQTKAIERAALANTNSAIVGKASWAGLTGTNTTLRTLISDRLQVANATSLTNGKATWAGLIATNTSIRSAFAAVDITKSTWTELLATNTAVRSLISARSTWTELLATNTSIRSAFASADNSRSTWAALTATNTAIRTLVSDRLQVANASTTYAPKTNAQISSLGVGTAASGTTGEIRATDNVTAYYSDERLKTILGPIENPLEKLKTLRGFYFEPNAVAQELGYKVKREVGISAQEVQRILPEIIAPAPISDLYMTVYYEKLIPLLIEGINALVRRVEELEGK